MEEVKVHGKVGEDMPFEIKSFVDVVAGGAKGVFVDMDILAQVGHVLCLQVQFHAPAHKRAQAEPDLGGTRKHQGAADPIIVAYLGQVEALSAEDVGGEPLGIEAVFGECKLYRPPDMVVLSECGAFAP